VVSTSLPWRLFGPAPLFPYSSEEIFNATYPKPDPIGKAA
jgi:hypothetical protein